LFSSGTSDTVVAGMPNCLLLVDAYSMIYRAFYAIRSLTGPEGRPVNAIFGFTKMLRKLLAERQPTHCAVVFDLGAPKARLAILPSYKEHRPPTPPDLDAQLPAIRAVLNAMRMPIVEVEGDEADDIIATLAVRAARDEANVLIASNDKDFAQLVDDHICLLRANAEQEPICDAAGVQARFGVRPGQIVDLLCLIGDSVDNIPGVPGIGQKTAADLLARFGSLDQLLARTREIARPKIREALLAAADRLRLNRSLIALQTDMTLPVSWTELTVQRPDSAKLAAQLKEFGFKSLVAELEKEAAASDDLFART
jgi:DNA polymerase-1